MTALSTSIQIFSVGPSQMNKSRKEKKFINLKKEIVKLSLFVTMSLCTHKVSIKKICKVTGYKMNIKIAFLSTRNKTKEIKKFLNI